MKYKGDVEKKMVSPFGIIQPRRAYYVCTNIECTVPSKNKKSKLCRYSVCPLDRRLGLDRDHFLPCVQEVVVWLTSLDPYGKCLEFVGKLLQFSICHRSAWLITQKVGDVVKERQQEAIDRAFSDPLNPVFPQAEVPTPNIGVVEIDGTCGRIDHEDGETDEEDLAGEDPDAPLKKPDFREVKAGLVAHLVPPAPKPVSSSSSNEMTADTSDSGKRTRRKQHRKVRPHGEEPTLKHKKLAVHLGKPLPLFQALLLLIYRLGLDKAKVILAIGDGAHWIWCGVREHFSGLGVTIVEILDYWHAVEHLWRLSNSIFGKGTAEA
ncbi:MAG: hypothetical protein ACREP9_23465, partial [Candidatus Dormibacteraceae bacterium]